MRQRPKSLMIDIDEELHHKIKKVALEEHITIKNWVTLALLEKLNKKRTDHEIN